ncbi:hypothetical protein PG997_013551 [Apiospora hydei]|uniref:Uncharacterized protein n=1 Tax=Apiospora hydei TaxID=1337664 RepID=A0ABR1V6H1_9PEZI
MKLVQVGWMPGLLPSFLAVFYPPYAQLMRVPSERYVFITISSKYISYTSILALTSTRLRSVTRMGKLVSPGLQTFVSKYRHPSALGAPRVGWNEVVWQGAEALAAAEVDPQGHGPVGRLEVAGDGVPDFGVVVAARDVLLEPDRILEHRARRSI